MNVSLFEIPSSISATSIFPIEDFESVYVTTDFFDRDNMERHLLTSLFTNSKQCTVEIAVTLTFSLIEYVKT